MYPEIYQMPDAIAITDLDYEEFIEENSRIFQAWKGALTHTELCRMDIYTRFKYITCLLQQIEERKKQTKEEEEKIKNASRR